ncbi:MAG: Ig-like domain-containing protein [Candidatus Azobacteroides sp.]|nr:Ig-like domain-containing protein [Candidatus Azobacteroides sp.]
MEVSKVAYNENPPTVTLTAPADNSTFEARTNITLSAQAESTEAEILFVEFFRNNEKIGEATTAPYEVTWRALEGTHVLTAKATASDGLSATSEGITVFITPSGTPSGPCEGQGTFTDEDGVVLTNYTYSLETVERGVLVNIEYSGGTRTTEHVYLHDHTDGFREIYMEKTGNVYSVLLDNYVEDGTELTLVIKCIYMGGGDDFTEEIKYTVGENCDPTGLEDMYVENISIFKSGKTLCLSGLNEDAEISLFDINGRLIKSIFSKGQHTVSLTDLSGVYIVKIVSKEGIKVFKAVN